MEKGSAIGRGAPALAGAVLLYFIGWRWNVPLASWVAPILLSRFTRESGRTWHTVILVPMLAAVCVIQVSGGWDVGFGLQIVIATLRATGFYLPLLVD